ncbi:MAG: D-glucuronyl C5-epimerase family protein [Candidatus Hodarchaeota archaeon]
MKSVFENPLAWSRIRALLIILLILLTIALIIGGFLIYKKQQRLIDIVQKNRRGLTEIIDSFVPIPVLKNIEIQEIRGHRVKLIPFHIIVSKDLDYIHNRHKKSSPGLLIKQYLVNGKTISFHPKQWSHNLLNLCSHAEQRNGERDQPLLDYLLKQFESHIAEIDSAIFVGYPFRYEIFNRILEPNWYSCIAQGHVLAALVKLYETTNNSKYLGMAKKTQKSFLQVRNEVGQKKPWISFVDDAQYLWFEEYPSTHDLQPRVLNGHIYALMGLYSYYRLNRNDETLTLLQAGMTTVQRYFNEYRRPGRINNYCLLPNSPPDYKPSRSIKQQEWLFHVTNAPVFKEQLSAFQTDMPF